MFLKQFMWGLGIFYILFADTGNTFMFSLIFEANSSYILVLMSQGWRVWKIGKTVNFFQ